MGAFFWPERIDFKALRFTLCALGSKRCNFAEISVYEKNSLVY